MSSSDSGTPQNPLIRELAAELAAEPAVDAELPPGLLRRRDSWLAQFRAGTLPFQQEADEPALDLVDVELFLLLEQERVFRSRGPADDSGWVSPGLRVETPEKIVVVVRRAVAGDTWGVRVRSAAPGRYRAELLWADGSRRSAELLVVDTSSDYAPVDGPGEPPARVRLTRLDG
jgi:hypothetical protein